ncbi:MAG TPA: acyl-CoA synthetase [Ktedonobacterales bacterium]|nr:acyl-CoA synthetase [Ktedonobacterales bacterium]
MRSIVEAVRDHAAREPERPAIIFEGQTITYGALYARVEGMARALRAWGLASGDRVALFLENCPEFVVAYLGVHLAGGVVVLVNAQYRQVELSHILTDSGARLCVTTVPGSMELSGLAAPDLEALVIVYDANPTHTVMGSAVGFEEFLARGDAGAETPLSMPDADAPAVIAYTSGTTGRAKGALLLHRNLVANIAAVTTAWGWTAADRLLLALPLFHTHGLMVGMHGTLSTGASVILRRRFDAAEILGILNTDANVTMFFGVPTMYRRLLAEAERTGAPAHRLRLYVSGSAPLDSHLFAAFARVFGQKILERYGMTETIMNLTNPYEGERRAGAVGGPFPGQEARVVDTETRRPLPDGDTGEIEVRGPHVFAGYWNRPDATADAFAEDGWFKTGDLGWRSADGYYTIAGRARELIISGGYNIYPREVEDALAAHSAVAEVAVLGLPDADLGEQVVAVVVPVDGAAVSADELVAYCRERLASYKKPRRVVFVESLPRNALGKVQKHLLAAEIQRA